ncbi:MAG: elongation factor G [Planctomycetaceae bacterium]|nr:elongation factor G [Planctomycetaceae bacterium]
MSRQLENLRNIGIIAHIDAGKTTLTERMLFYSGATHRLGDVDKGTTETDFDEEEQQRGITIYSACVTFQWNNVDVNLIDTPGHVDFTAEVERCLRVLDGGVVVFSAREGVEAQSETVWRQADRYGVPRIAFINKLDREGADFDGTLNEIRDRLEANPVPIQLPIGLGPPHLDDPFRGAIDLIEMRQLTFEDKGKKVVTAEIPGELQDDAELARHAMLEELSKYNDEVMELMLEENPVPTALIHQVIRDATLQRAIQPVLCGSALDHIGVQPVLDAVDQYLPSPADMPPVEGEAPGRKAKDETHQEQRKPTGSEPFCGLVFKVVPAKTGDISWVRIYSGSLNANTRALNPGRNKKENIAQLWHLQASRRGQVPSADTGDIVAIIGLRHSVTGDTLCDPKHPLLLESIEFPETVMSMAIEPETTAERKKLADTLEMMRRQDPTFSAVESEDTGQTLISGMGELHLEVIRNRLLRDFNLDVKVHKPRVSYRETIDHTVEVRGECHRQMGGQDLFAEIALKLEPAENQSAPVTVTSRCPPQALPGELLAEALDELRSRGEGGGILGGFPLMNMKATLMDAKTNENTNDVAVRIATGVAYEKGLQQAGPVLLEPIMKLNINTPEEHLGDFVGDLQQRRAIIHHTDNRGKLCVIEAHAPLSELFGYSSAMRSLSQGRADCSMEPLHYAPAPAEIRKLFEL